MLWDPAQTTARGPRRDHGSPPASGLISTSRAGQGWGDVNGSGRERPFFPFHTHSALNSVFFSFSEQLSLSLGEKLSMFGGDLAVMWSTSSVAERQKPTRTRGCGHHGGRKEGLALGLQMTPSQSSPHVHFPGMTVQDSNYSAVHHSNVRLVDIVDDQWRQEQLPFDGRVTGGKVSTEPISSLSR